jgi:hypothetical protein
LQFIVNQNPLGGRKFTMEGLPFDFAAEDDPVDESAKEKSKLKSKSSKITLGKEIIDLLASNPKKIEAKTETIEVNGDLLGTDKTPELDTEAPVERLSIVESEAINQTLAAERLADLHTETDLSVAPEDGAAEAFLVDVESSGNIEKAFGNSLSELGIDRETYVAPPIEDIERIVAAPTETDEPIPITPTTVIQIHQQEAAVVEGIAQVESEADTKDKRWNVRHKSANINKSGSSLDSIVNYLVARRRPRIKTSKDVEPVRNRLENEVIELKIKLANKESQIRRVAKQVPRSEVFVAPEKITAMEARRESAATIKRNVEKISRQTNIRPELTNLKAQTMTRVELLSLASEIDIDGTNLKQVYESHLITELGLRRVISIYLRGGNVKRSLRRELVEREIDFERDPSLRDQASDAPMASATASIEQLLEKSGINWSQEQVDEKPDDIDISNIVNTAKEPSQKQSKIVRISDIFLVGLILIIVVIILALLINR